jgi:hypothetical protein
LSEATTIKPTPPRQNTHTKKMTIKTTGKMSKEKVNETTTIRRTIKDTTDIIIKAKRERKREREKLKPVISNIDQLYVIHCTTYCYDIYSKWCA